MDVREKRASMRLCDLDEIKICVDRQYENCHGYSGSKKAIYREAILAVKSILHSAKPVDAVPVVRCWECKHGEIDDPDFPDEYYCHAGCGWNNGDFYCAYGERKEGAD